MALAATMVFEVRTTGSDTQCAGGFNSARGGTDYSQQNAAQATGTVTSAAAVVTATTAIFTSLMVGNMITDGTTFKEIIGFTSTTVVTVDSAPSWAGATIYVGGALASPGLAASLAQVTGQIIYQKTGSYALTSTSSNVAGGRVTLATGVRLQGYQTVRGDNGTGPTLLASGIASVTLLTIGTGATAWNVIVDGANLTGIQGISVSSAQSLAYLCSAQNCKNVGIQGAGGGWAIRCYATGCSTGTGAFNINSGNFVDCVASGNSVSGFDASGGVGLCLNCLSLNNTGASSHGFGNIRTIQLVNCVAYGNGGSGFAETGFNGERVRVLNCIAEGNSLYGFDVLASTNGLITNCATYNNTSGAFHNTPGMAYNNVTGTSSFFTNAAGGDFSLNATAGGGAACRATGIPGVFPGISTTGYMDIGAVQHACAASGGLLIAPGLGGGIRG